MNHREILTTILGLVMMVNGAYFTYVCVSTSEFSPNGEFASALVILLAGFSIVLFLRKELKHGIIASLMAVGISMILRYAYLMFEPKQDIELLAGDLYLIISVILIYYSASLMFHTSAGSTKALVCLGLLVVTELFPVIYYIYMGSNIIDVISDHRNGIVYGMMHLTILLILTRKEMLLEGATRRLARNSDELFRESGTPPDAYIDVPDVKELIADPEDGWTYQSFGPVQKERRIMLHGIDMEILLQKRVDDPRTQISLSPKNDGSYSIPLSFPIEKIVLDGENPETSGMVRIYGTDGLFMDIVIKDYDKEKKTYIETIRHMVKKSRAKRS